MIGRRGIVGGIAALLADLAGRRAMATAPLSDGAGCRMLSFEGANYAVCTFDLRRYEARLHWLGADGQPYASVGRLADAPGGDKIAMAMNAGMYHPDLKPVGLYVENGRELARVSRANGPGNFHLKPNGVFYVTKDGRAGMLETDAFLKTKPTIAYATQSGPMLVIDGALHPKFSNEGESHKIRNGVGVSDARTAVFAISREPVSFGAFARLFRDALGCRNALFLDGSISSLYAPALGRRDVSLKPLGPLVSVTPRASR